MEAHETLNYAGDAERNAEGGKVAPPVATAARFTRGVVLG